MSAMIRYEFDAERQVLIKCSPEDSPKIIEKNNLVWRDFGPKDEPYARAIYGGQGCWERLDTIDEEKAQSILTQWGYLSSASNGSLSMEQCNTFPKRVNIPPEQIEQLAYHDLVNINWESIHRISSATAYAQFLFQKHCYYFYVPETGTFFSVEQDGNYYHGYETVVRKCSKAEVLAAATSELAYARKLSLKENIITYWKNICSLINEY